MKKSIINNNNVSEMCTNTSVKKRLLNKVNRLKEKVSFLYVIILSGIFSITQFGCDDALNLYPLDEVSDASFWQDPSEFKLAANDFYKYLRSFGNSNGDGRSGSDLAADRSAYARGTNSPTVTDKNYNQAYEWLRNINSLIENAKDYEKQEDIAVYLAEAHFFRAYVYFDKLLTNYGGVILVDKPLKPESPELHASRNTREETVDFIIKDLEDAIPDLPLENEILSEDKGRISRQAAQAFLGRVCLYEGTWLKFRNGDAERYNDLLEKAITNSRAVMESGDFSLFNPDLLPDTVRLKYLFILENQKSNPAGLTKADNNEYILEYRYESENLLQTVPGNISFYSFGDMSRKLADMFLFSDGLPIDKTKMSFSRDSMNSEFQFRDNRMKNFMAIPGNYYWQNATNWRITWLNDSADLANARGPHDTWDNGISGYENTYWCAEREVPNGQEGFDYPVIRLAEVYLNYAEAVYERNGSISDEDLDISLNLVRMRLNKSINMPKLSNAFVIDNGLDMREEIRRERTIELQCESFRMGDLKRWYIAHIELNEAVLGVLWKGTAYEKHYPKKNPKLNDEGYVIVDPESSRDFTDKNYLLPIPTDEISMNSNLKQNPGWE